MTNIASLNINLFTRVDQMVAGLRTAQTRLTRFGAGMSAIAARVTKIGLAVAGPLAALGSVAGITALTRQSFTLGDALGKSSDQLGIATERLAGLQFAAKLAGVESAALSSVIARLSSSLVKAAGGSKEPAEALARLGLRAEDLLRLSPDEQLLRIGDALRSVASASERIDLTRTLLGRNGGQQSLSLLLQGSDAIREQIAEAERLGLTLSRVDAARLENANDAIQRMRQSLQGVGNVIAIRIAPLIQYIGDRLTAITDVKSRLDSLFDGAVAGARSLGIALATLDAFAENILTAVNLVITNIQRLSTGLLAGALGALNSKEVGIARTALQTGGYTVPAAALGAVQSAASVAESVLRAASVGFANESQQLITDLGTAIDGRVREVEGIFQRYLAPPSVNQILNGTLLTDQDDDDSGVEERLDTLVDIMRGIEGRIDRVTPSGSDLRLITQQLRAIQQGIGVVATRR